MNAIGLPLALDLMIEVLQDEERCELNHVLGRIYNFIQLLFRNMRLSLRQISSLRPSTSNIVMHKAVVPHISHITCQKMLL